MELKNIYAIYICAGIALLFVFLAFFRFRRREKYGKGKKAVMPDYIMEIPYYRYRLVAFKVLKFLVGLACIASLMASSVLMARPYVTEISETEESCRDIILCLDVSTSVDELNYYLSDKLISTVDKLQGDRFGIIIFNTSPVMICPLTTDYEYVKEMLTNIKKALSARNYYYSGFGDEDDFDFEESMYLSDFISNGTLVGNERGSSLIGDGLASTTCVFPDEEDGEERTKLVIFATDNELCGEPFVTLPEAGELCEDNGVVVYGIGTDFMYGSERDEMKTVVENTGGKFYIAEDEDTVSQIVKDIEKHGKNTVKIDRKVTETEFPEKPYILLFISVSLMMLFAKIARL